MYVYLLAYLLTYLEESELHVVRNPLFDSYNVTLTDLLYKRGPSRAVKINARPTALGSTQNVTLKE